MSPYITSFVSKGLSACYVRITYRVIGHVNLLNPTGYVMHQQFNIQKLYALPTL